MALAPSCGGRTAVRVPVWRAAWQSTSADAWASLAERLDVGAVSGIC